MQPNDQQGLNQPGQGQPVPAPPPQPPVVSPPPAQNPQNPPLAPIPSSAPILDTAAVQAALDEPAPGNPSAALAPEQPVVDEPTDVPDDDQAAEGDVEEYDDLEEPVTWAAHEYINQEKSTTWFLLFGIVVVALIAISIFFMHSWSFAILMAVIAVVVVVYSRRPPRELTYSLNNDGLTIDGGKVYEFSQFKSFGVIRDGEHFSVMLIPTQRFQPGVTIYFPEEAGEDIVDVLGSRLPMKELKLDAVDRVVRLLRL